jgi:hypothetical protein
VEQRRLRLGDILDDYCPRERRVTNHAVVAMIEEDVKQTRCTTCDAEHAYKGGKAPRRRKKDAPALAGALDLPAVVGAVGAADSGDAVDDDAMDAPDERIEAEAPLQADAVAAAPTNPDEPHEQEPVAPSPMEDGPVHRPLIRAQLPRPEGQKIERQIPDFTVRHAAAARRGNGGFGGSGRPKMRTHGGGTGIGNGNGNRPHGRFSGPRPGASGRSGAPAGFRSGQPRHGGKKRSR